MNNQSTQDMVVDRVVDRVINNCKTIEGELKSAPSLRCPTNLSSTSSRGTTQRSPTFTIVVGNSGHPRGSGGGGDRTMLLIHAGGKGQGY